MPPTRRHRPAAPPARRPRVAGTRGRPSAEPHEAPQEQSPELTEAEATVAPTEPQTLVQPAEPETVVQPVEPETLVQPAAEPEVHEAPVPTPVVRRVPEFRPRPKPAEPEPEPEPEPQDEAAAEPAGEPEPVEADGAEADGTPPKPPWTKTWALPVVLVSVAAVLVIAGFLFRWAASDLEARSGADNEALVDAKATSEVAEQLTRAVQAVFSYNFADTAKSEQAAKDVLTGDAVKQYDELYAEVRKRAPEQKLVLTTIVRAAGVKELRGDRALVMIFADQHAVRTGGGAKEDSGQTQMAITAQRSDGKWKISNIERR